LRICEKLDCVNLFAEVARATGAPLSSLLTPGRHIKLVPVVYQLAQKLGFVIPTTKPVDQDSNAKLFDPLRLYYKEIRSGPDFFESFDKIVKDNNLCISTLVPKTDESVIEAIEGAKGARFVKKSVRTGLLPQVLEHLQGYEARDISVTTTALKIAAFSILSMVRSGGQMTCPALASTVMQLSYEDLKEKEDEEEEEKKEETKPKLENPKKRKLKQFDSTEGFSALNTDKRLRLDPKFSSLGKQTQISKADRQSSVTELQTLFKVMLSTSN